MILGIVGTVATSGGVDAITELDRVVVSTATSQITFSSINQTHDDLMISCRLEQASTAAFLTIRLNSDSGFNYSTFTMLSNNTTVASYNVTNIQDWRIVTNNNILASSSNVGQIEIPNYRSTSHVKQMLSSFGSHQSTNGIHWITGGRWNSTAAITTIQIRGDGSSNYINPGSVFTLYGIKRA